MSTPLTASGFAALTGISRETLARFEAYAALLVRWSGRINLVGRNTLGDLWRRHFLDSAQLLRFVRAGAPNLIDIGSGGGFPGLVLAVMGVPGVELCEADARKCVFLREAIRVTSAPAVVRHGRVEAAPPRPWGVVTARACAPLDRLLALSEPLIGPETVCLFLKGERADEELATARREGWAMTASRHPSVADRSGTILCLRQVSRERGHS